MPGRIEECLETTDASHIQKRSDDVRFALLLTYITLGWMTIEGAASLLLGWASKSLLLEAFGIDSVIELFSATILLWRLRVEAGGTATSQHVNLVEDRAARLVVARQRRRPRADSFSYQRSSRCNSRRRMLFPRRIKAVIGVGGAPSVMRGGS